MRAPAFVIALASALLGSACSDGGGASSPSGGAGSDDAGATSEPAEVTAAIDLCYRTLKGEIALRDDALAALDAATVNHPDSARAYLYLGMCSLAALAEDGDVGAFGAIEPALVRAIELAPDDRRIPGWLASVRVISAITLADELKLASAIEEMIAAADLYPEFNNVSLAIAFAELGLDTPYPQMAVERLEAITTCGETDERCRDNAAAPHNVPGSMMLFGDVYARVGRSEEARSYYSAALEADSAADWAERTVAQATLDELEARVAAFTDADPDNDPEFFLTGDRTCVGCHR